MRRGRDNKTQGLCARNDIFLKRGLISYLPPTISNRASICLDLRPAGAYRAHRFSETIVARSHTERHQLQVFVRDNNIEQALRVLKKKMQREGVFREMRQRQAYEKPSERKTREKTEAVRRARKVARKKAEREGLMPRLRKKKLPEVKRLGQRRTF